MRKQLAVLVFLGFATVTRAAVAIEIPSELQGKWIDETSELSCNKEEAFVTTIGESTIEEGDVSSCKVKKVSGKDGQYKMSSTCCSADGCSTTPNSSSYQVKDNILTIETAFGKKKVANRFKRCAN